MLSDSVLAAFRTCVRAGLMPSPKGAYDAMPPNLEARQEQANMSGATARNAGDIEEQDTDAETIRAAQKEPNLSKSTAKALVDWANDNLDERTCQAFLEMLNGLGGTAAADEPPDFPGRPHTGGTMSPMRGGKAMDARRAASKIGIVTTTTYSPTDLERQRAQPRNKVAMDEFLTSKGLSARDVATAGAILARDVGNRIGTSMESFAKRHPNAARITNSW